MALYDYELTVIADGGGDSLSATLVEGGLLDPAGRAGQATLFGMGVFVEDAELDVAGAPLRAARLLFDAEPFEAFIRSRLDELVAYVWLVAEAIEPLTMFVPSGSDARPASTRDDSFGDIPGLLAAGVPSVAHPIVYYGEALGGGALCRPRAEIEYYELERRPGLGCLYLFVSRSAAGAEILESGSLQPEMLAQLTP